MADTSVVANPGAGGASFKADADGGGVLHPYTKLEFGASGTQTEVADSNGSRLPVKVGDPLPAGTNIIGQTQAAPATSGGLSKAHVVALGSTNAQSIKASPGQLYAVRVFNNTSYPIFVKFHNTAGVPTAGVGVVETVSQQAGTGGQYDMGGLGDVFSTGIGMTITKGLADNDATAVVLNDCVVDVFYF